METASDLHGRGRSFGEERTFGRLYRQSSTLSRLAMARIESLCVQSQMMFDRELPANGVDNSSSSVAEDMSRIRGTCSNDAKEGDDDSPGGSFEVPTKFEAGSTSSAAYMADDDPDNSSSPERRSQQIAAVGPGAREHCLSHGSSSICGRRREMEDAVTVSPSFLSSPSQSDYFAVYDGHGGSEVATACADRMHHILAEEMAAVTKKEGSSLEDEGMDLAWKKAMMSCFSKMDAKVNGICWKGDQCGSTEGYTSRCCAGPVATEQVGSTALVAVVSKDKLIVANCGDSRAVLSRGGQPIPLSVDHKPDREDELARVEAAGGRVIYWNGARVLGCLAMSRAIGDRYLKPYVISDPEITVTERTEEDECLVLASDGLWDVVSNDTVCDIARKVIRNRRRKNKMIENSGEWECPAEAAAASLTKYAYDKGSTDNISVVVIDLKRIRRR